VAEDLKLTLATPERVALSLPLAGLGSRAIAYLVDLLLMLAAAFVGYFVYALFDPDPLKTWQTASPFARGMVGLLLFGFNWVYWTALEAFWHGQTLGKRALHIRVVRADGSPASLIECAIRNLMRAIDFLPACYPTGLIAMLVDAKHRRLGDLVAGTVLVREEKIDLERYAAAATGERRLSDADLELVTSFLSRAEALEPQARLALAAQLSKKLGGPAEGAEAQLAFLRSLGGK